jgi:uncharacterized iron-regulated protein
LTGSAVDPPGQSLERYYLAQCVKDETMAESIARARGGVRPRLVVHVNGAFHSDFGLGVVERVRRRLPTARVVVVTILPVRDIDRVEPDDGAYRRANFLIYTSAAN